MKDYLWLNIRELPYFRSLVRANEARFYYGIDLPRPILDIGSGDGHFASIAFDSPIDVGIDPWSGPIYKSLKYNIYRMVVQGNGADLPFSDAYFGSAISNSVLEHIQDVEAVLSEISRVLKPGSPFIFCVPNHHFLPSLSIGNLFDNLGLQSLGDGYRSFFNRISRHEHCDSTDIWQARLNQYQFAIERWWNYIPPEGFHVVEWGHYFGLPSLICHALTRRWILVSQKWNLFLTRAVVEKYYGENAVNDQGVYTFYIARKK